nr:hypothetical protein [Tanacetum cinerariifolium]
WSAVSSFNQFVHELSLEFDSTSSVDYSSGDVDGDEYNNDDDYLSLASMKALDHFVQRATDRRRGVVECMPPDLPCPMIHHIKALILEWGLERIGRQCRKGEGNSWLLLDVLEAPDHVIYVLDQVVDLEEELLLQIKERAHLLALYSCGENSYLSVASFMSYTLRTKGAGFCRREWGSSWEVGREWGEFMGSRVSGGEGAGSGDEGLKDVTSVVSQQDAANFYQS